MVNDLMKKTGLLLTQDAVTNGVYRIGEIDYPYSQPQALTDNPDRMGNSPIDYIDDEDTVYLFDGDTCDLNRAQIGIAQGWNPKILGAERITGADLRLWLHLGGSRMRSS